MRVQAGALRPRDRRPWSATRSATRGPRSVPGALHGAISEADDRGERPRLVDLFGEDQQADDQEAGTARRERQRREACDHADDHDAYAPDEAERVSSP